MGDKDNELKEIYRFMQDLEFVQCLANPSYLEYLSINNYFKDPSFIHYLEHLLYFKKPQYIKYITRAMIFLDLLQYAFFRKELENPAFITFLHNEIYNSWIN